MMLRTTTIAILVVVGLFCFSVAAEDETFKKVAPEPIVILTENGSGSARITFVRKPGVPSPQAVKVTDAVGTANSISEKDIRFQWNDPTSVSDKLDVVVGQISVGTKTFIEPGVAYKGNLILLRDKEQPLTFEYTIQNATSINFTLSPESPAIFLNKFQPGEIHFRVKNTGKSKITSLQYGLDLKNANGQRITTTTPDDPVDINPGQEKEFTAAIRQPTLAGTYTGNLNVTANKSERKSISVSVQTRGPNPYDSAWLPFWLFVIVLVLTCWLSAYLEDWFGQGGNLERAQAVLSFQKSQTDVAELARKLTKWEKDHDPAKVPRTQGGLAELGAELTLAIKNAATTSSADLKNEAQRFATETMAKNIFWTILLTATAQFPDPNKLKAVATTLDKVTLPYPLDLNGYRDSLRKELTAAISAAELGGAPAFAADVTKLSPEDITAKIKRMAWLNRLVIGMVVFVTAYQTLYFPNKAFGTSIDYIVVFLWALGLTQTGKAIIAKVVTPR